MASHGRGRDCARQRQPQEPAPHADACSRLALQQHMVWRYTVSPLATCLLIATQAFQTLTAV